MPGIPVNTFDVFCQIAFANSTDFAGATTFVDSADMNRCLLYRICEHKYEGISGFVNCIDAECV